MLYTLVAKSHFLSRFILWRWSSSVSYFSETLQFPMTFTLVDISRNVFSSQGILRISGAEYSNDLGTAWAWLEDACFSDRNESLTQLWLGRVFGRESPKNCYSWSEHWWWFEEDVSFSWEFFGLRVPILPILQPSVFRSVQTPPPRRFV